MNENNSPLTRVTKENRGEQHSTTMILGPIGSGKTRSLATLTPYGRTVIIDVDRQAGKLFDCKETISDNLEIIDVNPPIKPNGDPDWIATYQAVEKFLVETSQSKDPPFAIVIDTLTTLNEICLNYVRSIGNVDLGKTQLQHYNMGKEYLERLIRKFLVIRAVRVVNCHLIKEKDETTGRIVSRPNLPGQMADLLPCKFQNILFTEVSGTREKKQWSFITVPDDQVIARVSREMKPMIPQDFGIVLGKK